VCVTMIYSNVFAYLDVISDAQSDQFALSVLPGEESARHAQGAKFLAQPQNLKHVSENRPPGRTFPNIQLGLIFDECAAYQAENCTVFLHQGRKRGPR